MWRCDFGHSQTGDNKIRLLEALAQNKISLTKLVITQDRLEGQDMAKSIQRAIAFNTLLEYIQLGSCDDAVLEAVATGVEDNAFYKQIHVYGNGANHRLSACQKKIDLLLELNKAGRRYLIEASQETIPCGLTPQEFWWIMLVDANSPTSTWNQSSLVSSVDRTTRVYHLLRFNPTMLVDEYLQNCPISPEIPQGV